jgi:hypothetical protein
VNLGFEAVSVKQMMTTRWSPSDGTANRNLYLFFITLPKTANSQEIFNLPRLCNISIKVETYTSQTGLTQCHNSQQFGQVWANCRQLTRCFCFGDGHLHEYPEKENAASTPACCNCRLAEGEKVHPANYRGCRHATTKRKTQRTPKSSTGKLFS